MITSHFKPIAKPNLTLSITAISAQTKGAPAGNKVANPTPPVPTPSSSKKEPDQKKPSKSDGNAASSSSTNKPRRRNNPLPRPDIIELDIPIEKDTRYLRNGYEYVDKAQYIIDRQSVQAASKKPGSPSPSGFSIPTISTPPLLPSNASGPSLAPTSPSHSTR